MKAATSILALSIAVAGCTATTDSSTTNSGDTDTSVPLNTPVAVASFADGQGVLRADFTEVASAATGDVTKVVAFTHDVAAWVKDLSLADIEAIKTANLKETPSFDRIVVPELQGEIVVKTGLVSIGEDQFEVYVIEPTSGVGYGVIGVQYLGVGDYGSGSALAIGPKASNIPAGSFEYKGINFFGKAYDPNGTGSQYNGIGTFTLTADFANGTGNLTANTTELNITSLNGAISIDVGSAEFSGSDLVLGGTSGGTSLVGKTAAIEGSFHGSGATNITGLYYTDNLEYGGVLVGSKQ